MRDIDLYGVGNAIVDYELAVTDVELEELRLPKGGMRLVEAEEQLVLRQRLDGRAPKRTAGGSAANTVVALAQLGATTAYACTIGEDELGAFYAEAFERYGVRIAGERRPGHTGSCLVLVTPDGERTMNTHLGVSAELDPEALDLELLRKSRWLYLEGYLLASDSGYAAARRAAETARAHGVRIALTFSDGFIVDAFGERLRELVALADLVFANEREAAVYTGHREPDEAARLLAQEVPEVVVTHGAEGAYVVTDGTWTHVPAFPATPIDLTGAGDLFAAGFLYGRLRGWPVEAGGRLGAWLAHRVILQTGARLGGDLRSEAARFAPETEGA